jgi:3-oxoacyl-[acyl-carrier protein] reductase
MMDAPWRLDGQVALVTGGSRGIGRAVCRLLALLGAHVVINYREAADAAKAVARDIEAQGGGCELKAFDVADAAGVRSACREILDAHGRIEILVNNAGITRDQLFVRMKPEAWQRVLDVNLTGSYLCAKAVVKAMMKQRSGCIVNMASVAGLTGNPGQVNYSASKAGIIGLTKALAKELAAWNIRVNAVAPGYIETDMTEGLSDKVKEEILTFVPLQRFGTPDDVAAAVYYLVSPASRYVTGQVLNVGGGLYM